MALDVVALRAAGVGDLLTAVPALHALGEVAREGITLATPDWLHPLAPLLPGVSSVVDVDGLRPRTSLRGTVAVNLHGSGPQSHSALLDGDPADMVAFACPPLWAFGPAWRGDDPQEAERARLCRLVQWVGLDADSDRVVIARPSVTAPVTDAVVLHVGGTDPDRRWPPQRFAEVAKALPAESVVVSGGPGDLVTAQTTARLAGLPPERVLAGRMTLQDLAALVAAARLVVTGDTGAAHLAYAYSTPTVVIFGPASPQQWGPPAGAPSRVLRNAGTRPTAADVPVADVLAAIRDQLEQS